MEKIVIPSILIGFLLQIPLIYNLFKKIHTKSSLGMLSIYVLLAISLLLKLSFPNFYFNILFAILASIAFIYVISKSFGIYSLAMKIFSGIVMLCYVAVIILLVATGHDGRTVVSNYWDEGKREISDTDKNFTCIYGSNIQELLIQLYRSYPSSEFPIIDRRLETYDSDSSWSESSMNQNRRLSVKSCQTLIEEYKSK